MVTVIGSLAHTRKKIQKILSRYMHMLPTYECISRKYDETMHSCDVFGTQSPNNKSCATENGSGIQAAASQLTTLYTLVVDILLVLIVRGKCVY